MSHINTEELSDLLFEAMQKYMSGEIKLREGTDIYTKKIEALIDQALHQRSEQLIEIRKQAGLCLDAANSNLEKQRCEKLLKIINDDYSDFERDILHSLSTETEEQK